MKRLLMLGAFVVAALVMMESLAFAGNLGEFAPAGATIDGIIGVAWLLVIAAIVYGLVQGILKLAGHQWTDGMLYLAVTVAASVLVFVIMPPMLEKGKALASTPSDVPAVEQVVSSMDRGMIE